MTFKQQIAATCIGAFLGFLASLVIFWIKEAWHKSNHDKALIQNLRYELDFNLNLYKKYVADITSCIEAVGAESKNTWLDLNYSSIGRFFAIQFYQAGLIRKYFHIEDMKKWNDVFIRLGEGSEKYVLGCLDKWRAGTYKKDEIHSALNLERSHLQHALDMTEYIKNKIS